MGVYNVWVSGYHTPIIPHTPTHPNTHAIGSAVVRVSGGAVAAGARSANDIFAFAFHVAAAVLHQTFVDICLCVDIYMYVLGEGGGVWKKCSR